MKRHGLIFITALLITGCTSPVLLEPQAVDVVVSPNPPPAACKHVGQIMGGEINFFPECWTPKTKFIFPLNDLKNQASYLNANYVQILPASSPSCWGHNTTHPEATTIGVAYICPPTEEVLPPF